MNLTDTIIVIAAVIIVVAGLVWIFARRRRTQQLRSRFGAEYEDAVHALGSETKAEDSLTARQKRMEKYKIHSLTSEERESFSKRWYDVQARFVDDPDGAIREADVLVNMAMQARGYPMAEFAARAENISVDHPKVVRNYRAAHDIELRRARAEASTEDLRRAMVYYRDLFEELLEYQGVR
jgi:hypothetical protein